jgi:hypothetical protein
MLGKQIDQAFADQMVEKAILYCAEKKFAGDLQQTRQTLCRGRCDICSLLSDNLVDQISEYLGQMDKTVRSIYRFEPEYGVIKPSINGGIQPSIKAGINLVVWVDRKSAALNALVATLENLLSESRKKMGCQSGVPACFVLDIHTVDDKDVNEKRGFGMVIDSMLVRSIPVWKRPEDNFIEISHEPRSKDIEKQLASFDPELAPETALFEQAYAIEKLPKEEFQYFEHHLRELKVGLIRRLISDQLAYINIAKEWLTLPDLSNIYQRKIGLGKIGGKAAGMVLAERILKEVADEDICSCIHIPESYFLGSDLIYLFMAMNGLMHWNDQKYKSEEEILNEYDQIQAEFKSSRFPPEIIRELDNLLDKVGKQPLIVRSSSLLEDNFGTSFAGKYNSYFCPNQGTPFENMHALTEAIALTYASTLKPDALLYRRSKGLQDYDERMAILIQTVQGERFGRYFLPFGAGVAFSRNLYRWAPQIKREDGFARLVWGLGTRAVERVGNDYPRLVALSHPTLQPDDTPEAIRYYSQQYVDLIDLEENAFKTLPVHEVLCSQYPSLRMIAQVEQEGYFTTPRSRIMQTDIPKTAITFDELLRRTTFGNTMSKILHILEENYHVAVDMEFTIRLLEPNAPKPRVEVIVLQCRPQSHLQSVLPATLPKDIPTEKIIFSTHFMVPQGYLPKIKYVIYVDPEGYFSLTTQSARNLLTRVISLLNSKLENKSFICVGPGRWGTTNPDLGVYVGYADVFKAGALVELAGKGVGPAPEPSLGTHFFQDMMEAQIYPLAMSLDDQKTIFNKDFFNKGPNCIKKWFGENETLPECIRLIDVDTYCPDHHIEIVMDDEKGLATAFLTPDT